MPSLTKYADSHTLAHPRGRCRAIRQEFRLRLAAAALAVAGLVALFARAAFLPA